MAVPSVASAGTGFAAPPRPIWSHYGGDDSGLRPSGHSDAQTRFAIGQYHPVYPLLPPHHRARATTPSCPDERRLKAVVLAAAASSRETEGTPWGCSPGSDRLWLAPREPPSHDHTGAISPCDWHERAWRHRRRTGRGCHQRRPARPRVATWRGGSGCGGCSVYAPLAEGVARSQSEAAVLPTPLGDARWSLGAEFDG